jgi:hypothetical protein
VAPKGFDDTGSEPHVAAALLSSWQRLLPLVSAVIVTLLGAAIALKGLTVYIA